MVNPICYILYLHFVKPSHMLKDNQIKEHSITCFCIIAVSHILVDSFGHSPHPVHKCEKS